MCISNLLSMGLVFSSQKQQLTVDTRPQDHIIKCFVHVLALFSSLFSSRTLLTVKVVSCSIMTSLCSKASRHLAQNQCF